jgi:ubiquinone biosynthesis monooxygenase Coq7
LPGPLNIAVNSRKFSLRDKLLTEVDKALRVMGAAPRALRKRPADATSADLSASARKLSARLMRVNHSGEIAAQALYRGQALVSRDPALRAHLLKAADEEHDHLAWCQQRAEELGGRVSLLTPFWYAGSFAIGMAAGLSGDKTSLGFLAETERQVTEHLDDHLQQIAENDPDSRAILEQMREDEIRHGVGAVERGGAELPQVMKRAMQTASKVMTSVSFRL